MSEENEKPEVETETKAETAAPVTDPSKGTYEDVLHFLKEQKPHVDPSDNPEYAHFAKILDYEAQLKAVEAPGKVTVIRLAESSSKSGRLSFHKVSVELETVAPKESYEKAKEPLKKVEKLMERERPDLPRTEINDILERAYPSHSFHVMSPKMRGTKETPFLTMNIDGVDKNVILDIPKGVDLDNMTAEQLIGSMRNSLRIHLGS